MGNDGTVVERERRVLRERAARLAAAPPAVPGEGELLHALGFSLGRENYAVEHGFIREVLPLPPVTPLPCVPAFVRGIINVRGRIVALLDFELMAGLRAREIGGASKLIIISSAERELGLLADEIFGLIAIPLSAIQPSLLSLTDSIASYLKGVTADGWALLDAAKILADRNLVIDENVGRAR